MTRTITLCLLVLTLTSSASAANSGVGDLKQEFAAAQAAIAEARKTSGELPDGLIKSLVSARLEILRINEALIQQRLHAAESGSPVTMSTPASTPDPDRAAQLRTEIQGLERRISEQEAEAAKYNGGLMQAMLASTVAKSRLSQFVEEQRWVRMTDIRNMTVRFEAQEVIYSDGTREAF